eukprot:5725013-Prymnesium_polylepis.1
MGFGEHSVLSCGAAKIGELPESGEPSGSGEFRESGEPSESGEPLESGEHSDSGERRQSGKGPWQAESPLTERSSRGSPCATAGSLRSLPARRAYESWIAGSGSQLHAPSLGEGSTRPAAAFCVDPPSFAATSRKGHH